MSNEQATVPQWVCGHCFIHLVNGDCTEHDTCTPGSGDENDPMHLFDGMGVTPGMPWEYHSDECNAAASEGRDECDCETNTFSWSQCDGCGSSYGGVRYAVTGWIAAAA